MAQKIINKEILISYFQGNTSPEENAEILSWLQDKKDNIVCFQELKDTWYLYQPVEHVTPEASEWDKIQNRILTNQSNIPQRKILPLVLKYAAVFLFGFTLYFVYDKLIAENDRIESLVHTQTQFNEIIVPKGEKSQVVLSDGTRVWLNADSKFRYPTDFNDEDRTVYLEGEAYFDVAHHESQTFIVKTDDINVRVLGTRFNVKNYPEDEYIETTLVSGKIVVETGNNNEQTVVLKPNQKATFSKVKDKITVEDDTRRESTQSLPIKKKPISIAKVDTEPIISWKDQELVFDNETLVEAGVKLERWFGVKIEVNNEELKNIRYKGCFDNHYTLLQVLEVIKLTTPIRYTTSDDKVVIDMAEGTELQKKKRR